MARARRIAETGRFDTAQVYFNMLNPSAARAMPPRWTGQNFAGLLGACRSHDVGVIAIRVMAAGILLHGASWHLSTLLPQPYDAVLEDAKGALMGFHLAFLVTFLMAAFEELSMDRACALACAVMLSMLVDSYSARDLPSVLTCGFDPACWELPAVSQRKLDNVEELAVKLGGNCVLAVGCIWGVSLLRTAREEAAKEWYKKRGRSAEYRPFNVRRGTKNDDKPPRFVGLSTAEEGRLKVREGEVRIWTRRLERYEPLAQSVYYGGDLHQNSRKLRMPSPKKKSELNRSKTAPVNHIYAGGSVYSHKDIVSPGVLSVMGLKTVSGKKEDPFRLPSAIEGRRLPLARWLVHPDNGLAWRAVVNRVWSYHFGRGLAGNPNNLGSSGKKPAYPELLDWLARSFQESGGSFKKLHKLIMMSRAYRQSSHHPEIEKLKTKDPGNLLLAVFEPRRLSAEELRDSMLAISGELNRTRGGLPVFPEINMEVALSPRMIQFSLAPAYQASPVPSERNRRSIYAYRTRGLRDPLMEVFNKPDSTESCEARDSAAVTPQVFTLMNSSGATLRSIAMALRLQKENRELQRQLARAFRLTFSRYPSREEQETLRKHYHEMVQYHRGVKPGRVSYPTTIIRSLVEEFSGDPFEYTEKLTSHTNYTYDKTAADVTPETRALADICLVLLNANEFIYVY